MPSFKVPVYAADEDANDPMLDRADELETRIEDDFEYVMAGIERLVRESQYDLAMDVANQIAATLDSAIGIIGGDFSDTGDIEE